MYKLCRIFLYNSYQAESYFLRKECSAYFRGKIDVIILYNQKDKEGSEQLIREHTKTLKEGHSGVFSGDWWKL